MLWPIRFQCAEVWISAGLPCVFYSMYTEVRLVPGLPERNYWVSTGVSVLVTEPSFGHHMEKEAACPLPVLENVRLRFGDLGVCFRTEMVLSVKSYGPAMFRKMGFFVCIRGQSKFSDFVGNRVNRFNFSEANTSATCCMHCVGKHRITGTFTVSLEFEGNAFESWEVFE